MAENRFLSTVQRKYLRIALLVCKACIALRLFPVNYFHFGKEEEKLTIQCVITFLSKPFECDDAN